MCSEVTASSVQSGVKPETTKEKYGVMNPESKKQYLNKDTELHRIIL